MALDPGIRCTCGALRGVVHGASPASGQRVVCYCDDCQAFAHALGRAGEILGEQGGTDIFQTSRARLELTAGADRLACLRLTPKGPLRWHASCCRTPIGNTPASSRLPFIGLILFCAERRAGELDAAFGPVRMRIAARHARGKVPGASVHAGFPLRIFVRVSAGVLAARLRGDRAPFFDPETRAPIATPQLLTPPELERLKQRSDSRAPL